MKVKTISRSSDTYIPARNTQASALPRNLNPALHPFERAREYTRALTATKLERMFAKPFLGQLGDGHEDGVYHLAKNPHQIGQMVSGAGDGVVKIWDLGTREEIGSVKAHYGMCSGVSVVPTTNANDGKLLSCGDDKTVKLWAMGSSGFGHTGEDDAEGDAEEVKGDRRGARRSRDTGLIKTFVGEHGFKGVDHHRTDPLFVTGGAQIQLWDTNRSNYLSNLSWGIDNVNTVKFNHTETNIVASCGGLDNAIVLYDIRTNTAVQRTITTFRNNCISWNPMEAFNFVTGNEDHNAYLWDMRKMSHSLNIYKDHVAAVTDVDFSPTGEQIVTGSYDKTIRIYNARDGHSRDIYHTKRMQHVFCTKFTMDAKYIISGSDDTNLRVWRSVASERADIKSMKQRNKLEYDEKLKQRFKDMPEIRRISRHRHVPKVVKKAQEIKKIELDSIKRRRENEVKFSKSAKDKRLERERHVRGTVN